MDSSSGQPPSPTERSWQWDRQRVLAAVTALAVLALLAISIWGWREVVSWWTLVWWLFPLIAVRASRPEFAAAAAAAAIWLQPAVGLPMVALAALTSAALGPRPFWIEALDGPEPIDRVGQNLVQGLPSLAAVVAGGLTWRYFMDSDLPLVATVAAAAVAAVTARAAEIAGGRSLPLHRGDLVHTAWWLMAWSWGGVLVAASGTPVWVAIGLAALLAARREGSWTGSVAADSISRTADVPEWVEQVYALALEVTHCAWFELRLAVGGAAERWSAGPEQQLAPGPAAPPARPPVRLGIHRRPDWMTERHARSIGDGDLELLVWRDPRVPLEAALEEHMDTVARISAAGRFDSAVANLPGGELVDRQRVLELLNGAFASARESGDSLAIALVGLDHSRELQEVHGAETCERAMAGVGGTFASLLGDQDAVCRYGGEEFLALFLGRNGEAAVGVGEAIRAAVSELELETEGEKIPVTVSVGIVAHPEVYVARPSELIPMADSSLYEARRGGGNRLLLSVGRGRFQAVDGEVIEGSVESQEVAAPRLFV